MKATLHDTTGQETFPLTIKKGSVSVRVYRQATRDGGERFQVADYSSGLRCLRTYATREKAIEEAQDIAARMAKGEIEVRSLTKVDVATLRRARELTSGTGVSIETALHAWREAFDLLGGNRIGEAARFFHQRHPTKLPDRTVPGAVTEFLEFKKSSGLRPRSLSDLEYRLSKFKAGFACNLQSITGPMIETWLAGTKPSPQSRLNFVRVLSNFFGYCRRRGWLSKDWDELAAVERVRVKRGETEVFSPKEMAALLANAPEEFIPVLALGGFAGLRSNEIERVRWEDIDLKQGFIVVKPERAKTGSRRTVNISATLRVWLAPRAKEHGLVWPEDRNRLYNLQQIVARAAKVEWRSNALRHSFASYELARTNDVNALALQLGNSPTMIHQHYKALTRPADAKKWFSILPERGPKPAVETRKRKPRVKPAPAAEALQIPEVSK